MKNSFDKKIVSSKSVSLAGLKMDVYPEYALNQAIHQHIESGVEQQMYCAHHNMHSLAIRRESFYMNQYHKLATVHWLDGMPLVFMLRQLGYEVSRDWRITFLDWQHSFYDLCVTHEYKIFMLGARPDSIKLATKRIRRLTPKLEFDYHHGYLSNNSQLEKTVIKKIEKFKPDILIIGMGMPLQERWALINGPKTNAKVIMPIGGYFDYMAGETYTPPRWAGKLGLEWAARLLSSPRKLGYRYIVEPWPVIYSFITEWIMSSKLRN